MTGRICLGKFTEGELSPAYEVLRFALANFGSELPPAREVLRFALANFGSELPPAREVLRFAVANFESERLRRGKRTNVTFLSLLC